LGGESGGFRGTEGKSLKVQKKNRGKASRGSLEKSYLNSGKGWGGTGKRERSHYGIEEI